MLSVLNRVAKEEARLDVVPLRAMSAQESFP
jgi:hypothetical protein